MAFDETGRLFGISPQLLLEFDPTTLQLLEQEAYSGPAVGIAARNGLLYSLSGAPGPSEFSLITFDADTFAQVGGTYTNAVSSGNALVFDETGRLFGISSQLLLEFDPITLQLLKQEAYSGPAVGIAARNGLIYSLSGAPGASGFSLITFDADTFAQVGGTYTNAVSSGNALAFDETGRLFGVSSQLLLEFDPTTLQLLRQETYSGPAAGIAARVPETSAFLLVLPAGTALCLMRRLKCFVPKS